RSWLSARWPVAELVCPSVPLSSGAAPRSNRLVVTAQRATGVPRMVRTPQDPERLRRFWDNQAGRYDRRMALAQRLFGDTRAWLCGQAAGETLEIAIGTGMNLRHYPRDIRLTGMDLSPGMLRQARRRSAGPADPTLTTGNAQQLEFGDATFDTVVCTFSLCGVPDDRAAVVEMWRVLRPGGLLLLADHVVSTA